MSENFTTSGLLGKGWKQNPDGSMSAPSRAVIVQQMQTPAERIKELAATVPGKKLIKSGPPKMNQTERDFSLRLEARKRAGEIREWKFAAVRLRWSDDFRYLADFWVHEKDGTQTLLEIKGKKIWDRDVVRWKGCAAEWKHVFKFEMWQRISGVWSQIR